MLRTHIGKLKIALTNTAHVWHGGVELESKFLAGGEFHPQSPGSGLNLANSSRYFPWSRLNLPNSSRYFVSSTSYSASSMNYFVSSSSYSVSSMSYFTFSSSYFTNSMSYFGNSCSYYTFSSRPSSLFQESYANSPLSKGDPGKKSRLSGPAVGGEGQAPPASARRHGVLTGS
ncbi:MAG: hypothetical protein HZA89_03185 [Verrucomicrobia bacterium]|nr:hypothetical protein [Verrucomicrobiota bacterium]